MIKIGEDYIINQDNDHYELARRKKTEHKKAKSEYVWTKTYHASIKQCCAAIADAELRKAVDSGIVKEFTVAIDRLCLAVEK